MTKDVTRATFTKLNTSGKRSGQLIKLNKKTVIVQLSDGKFIKRHFVKHKVKIV